MKSRHLIKSPPRLHTSVATAVVAGALALVTSGCGQQSFVPVSQIDDKLAPGHFQIPPKVDILLAEDDTTSMNQILPVISQQMPAFLANLDAKNWDYHFATIPLTHVQSVSQVVGSRFDGNWGSEWKSPFPGASPSGPGMILGSVFSTIDNFSGFIQTGVTASGDEYGFKTIRDTFATRLPGTGFLRDDALLVILVVGNGNDTSDVAMCTRSDGATGPCEAMGFPTLGTAAASFDSYKASFQALKPDPRQVKFFSDVSALNHSNGCIGARSFSGTRYMNMASALGGQSFDICSVPVSAVLNGVEQNLAATKVAFRTRYLFIDKDADPATIVVTKFPAGDTSQAETLAMDATNGWTYAGQVSNVFAIDYPINMNQASGYAIELHGSARLVGDDTARVEFRGAGTQSSSTN